KRRPAAQPRGKAWLLSQFLPAGGLPILLMSGTDNSGKTLNARTIPAVLDPNPSKEQGAPRGRDGLAALVRGSWTVTLDNLSSLTRDESDDLCRLSTGTTFAARNLFTNFDSVSFPS